MMLPAYNWILEGSLAGSGRPGLLSELDEDLGFLVEEGIKTIVTLTESPLAGLEAWGQIESIHFPVPDMGFPMPRQCADLCRLVLRRIQVGAVLLHCHAGLGRTGTIAACCLVSMGEDPARALQRVRLVNRRYVQTASQERFIHHFADHVAGPARL